MEVICINDTFTQEQITNIPNRPVKDKLYTIRDIIFYSHLNKTAVLLNEIENPELLTVRFGVECMFEPSFDIERFATLNNTPISNEHISEFKKARKDVFVPLL
jgi:hypothetical protein